MSKCFCQVFIAVHDSIREAFMLRPVPVKACEIKTAKVSKIVTPRNKLGFILNLEGN